MVLEASKFLCYIYDALDSKRKKRMALKLSMMWILNLWVIGDIFYFNNQTLFTKKLKPLNCLFFQTKTTTTSSSIVVVAEEEELRLII